MADIDSIGLALFRRVYRRCAEIARAEVVGAFGQAYQGGKWQWPHLLPGHGYELTQHGTYTFTTTDIPADTDTATVTRTYPIAYAAGVVPDVSASSHDVGWIASAAPTPGNEETQIDIALSRRIPLTNPQSGTVAVTFPSGASQYVYAGNPVTFPTAYDPVVTPNPVVIPQSNVAGFVARAINITTTGFDLVVDYQPNASSGTVGTPTPNQSDDNTTDTTGMWGVGTGTPVSPIETQLAYSKVAGANGSGGDGTTGNNSDGTDTGAASRSPNTGAQSQDHTHLEHDAGGQTGGESVGHDHAMDHTHPHNASGGNHTHPVPDAQHKHGMVDHVHNMNNHHHGLASHTHAFTGLTSTTSGVVHMDVTYQAFGTRAAPAVSKLLTWTAVGQQAS
jgi:hypothetical protein